MTRETKIGLLVGLAFIIVIGILLGQQARNSIEPPPAALPQVTGNVLRSVSTPGNPAPVPPAMVVTPLAPREIVPTPSDVRAQTPPIHIEVRPGNIAVRPPAVVQPAPTAPPVTPAVAPDNVVADRGSATTPPVTDAHQNGVPQSLRDAASQQGMELVGPGADSTNTTPGPIAAANTKKYVAQAGDSVSKMAARFLGANNTANRNAIIKANPALQKNNDVVIIGQTYLIPAATTPSTPAAITAITPTPALVPAIPTHTAEIWYTVKKGDTLSKIAADELGDASAKDAIIELNKDKIKDANAIYENMKIRLPAKPLASAQ